MGTKHKNISVHADFNQEILQVQPSLFLIIICFQLQLNASVLHVVAQDCVNLTLLDLGTLTAVDDSLCFTIAANCQKLTSLSLKGAKQVSKKLIKNF